MMALERISDRDHSFSNTLRFIYDLIKKEKEKGTDQDE